MDNIDVNEASSAAQRHETEAERLDRNYNELLQELRVVQTGVQILFAFLLTLPFYERFQALSPGQVRFYFATLLMAVVAALLLIAPVSHHRVLFRQAQKEELVRAANRLAIAGLGFVLLSLAGAVTLITDVLYAGNAAAVLGFLLVVLTALLWFVAPRLYRD